MPAPVGIPIPAQLVSNLVTSAFVLCLLPASVACLAGLGIAWPALAPAFRRPELRGLALVTAVMPMTSVIFAFVVAFLAADWALSDNVLLAFAAVAALTVLIQAFVTRARFPTVVADPNAFGKFLIMVVWPEVLVILALMWIVVAQAPQTTA